MSGRLRAQSLEMRQFFGDLHNEQGESFNDQVADHLARDADLIVRRRVSKVGKLKGEAGPPGDIDILVADRPRQRLLVIECKDFAVARIPSEMANEMGNLFLGREGKRSVISQHQRRVDWVAAHLDEILLWLRIQPGEHWNVEPLIVVDQELMSPHLQRSPMPIVSLDQLELHLGLQI